MDNPLIFKYFLFQKSFSDANDAPLQLDSGLNGTVGGATSDVSKGLDVIWMKVPS